MNRIRNYNNKYQVLITPSHDYNTDIEILLGSWTDTHLRNFFVLNFDSLADAQCEAFKYPDINWYKLILMYRSDYTDLSKIIQENLSKNEFIVDFEPNIMTPDVLKNTIFNRVIAEGKKFFMFKNMNDILSYKIVNPWSKNLQEIARILEMDQRLHIVKKSIKHNVIQLVGKTHLGITYEIILWPTLLSQWVKWTHKTPKASPHMQQQMFTKALNLQKNVDSQVLFV